VQPLLVSRAFQASAPALAGPGMYALGPVKVGEHPSLFIEPSLQGLHKLEEPVGTKWSICSSMG